MPTFGKGVDIRFAKTNADEATQESAREACRKLKRGTAESEGGFTEDELNKYGTGSFDLITPAQASKVQGYAALHPDGWYEYNGSHPVNPTVRFGYKYPTFFDPKNNEGTARFPSANVSGESGETWQKISMTPPKLAFCYDNSLEGVTKEYKVFAPIEGVDEQNACGCWTGGSQSRPPSDIKKIVRPSFSTDGSAAPYFTEDSQGNRLAYCRYDKADFDTLEKVDACFGAGPSDAQKTRFYAADGGPVPITGTLDSGSDWSKWVEWVNIGKEMKKELCSVVEKSDHCLQGAPECSRYMQAPGSKWGECHNFALSDYGPVGKNLPEYAQSNKAMPSLTQAERDEEMLNICTAHPKLEECRCVSAVDELKHKSGPKEGKVVYPNYNLTRKQPLSLGSAGCWYPACKNDGGLNNPNWIPSTVSNKECPKNICAQINNINASEGALVEYKVRATMKCPETKPPCNGHGRINDDESACICDKGWTGPNCTAVDVSTMIKMHCTPENTEGYDVKEGCECTPGWTGTRCQTVDQQAMIKAHCDPSNTQVYDLESKKCICNEGQTGPKCKQKDCGVHGKTSMVKPGKDCVCDPGWKGEHCKTPIVCNDHGTKSTTPPNVGECICDWGWKGQDCDDQMSSKELKNLAYRKKIGKQKGCESGEVNSSDGNCVPLPPKPPTPRSSSMPLVPLIALAVVVLLAIGVGVWLYRKNRRD